MASHNTWAIKAFIDGDELLRICEAASESGFARATDCLGYITGLSDTHEAFVALGLTSKQWCWPPEGVTNKQMARTVFRYLQDNPEILDRSAALLSTVALFEAYPCK